MQNLVGGRILRLLSGEYIGSVHSSARVVDPIVVVAVVTLPVTLPAILSRAASHRVHRIGITAPSSVVAAASGATNSVQLCAVGIVMRLVRTSSEQTALRVQDTYNDHKDAKRDRIIGCAKTRSLWL